MRNAPKKVAQSASPEAIAVEISRLPQLPLNELKTAWSTEFRRDVPKGMWRDLLLRMLAWRLQEKAFGGHDRSTLKLLDQLGKTKPGDQRLQRLKAGTVLIRDFEGVRHTVSIVPGGFVWQDQTFSSLSAIARIITGTNWNGPRFFGLREGQRAKNVQPRDNRMTPSHSRKKGVRYRYYVSQAVLQSRKGEAGEVSRVPAPEIEAEIEQFVRLRAPDPHGDVRAMIGGQVARMTIQTGSISVELAAPEAAAGGTAAGSGQMVSLAWSRKPFRATKGAVGGTAADVHPTAAGQTVLAGIGRARRWVDEIMAGATVTEIATREGKGERQIRLLMPLAFMPPTTMQRLLDGSMPTASVTELARKIPLIWQTGLDPASACLPSTQ